MKRALLASTAAATVVLTACGGGDSKDLSQSSSAARVEYSDASAFGSRAVQNYTNADWLYQNYLGSYGLPDEAKPTIMPAIQMLANGFALQFKRGEDVEASIKQFEQAFLGYVASGQALEFVRSMNGAVQAPAVVAGSPEPQAASQGFVPPEMTDEDKAAVAEAHARDEAIKAEVLAIAKANDLPYDIEGQTAQWFIYSPSMKVRRKAAPTNNTPRTHADISRWGWRMGDMIWSNGTNGTGVPGHIGIVDRRMNGSQGITDANTNGVHHYTDMNAWANRYTEVRAYSPKLNFSWADYNTYNTYGAYVPKDAWMRVTAVSWANSQIGKPYNWNFVNPGDTSKFYCSSLVWAAYRYVGYNLLAPYVVTNGLILPEHLGRNAVMFKSSAI